MASNSTIVPGELWTVLEREKYRARRNIPLSAGRSSNVLSDHVVQRRDIVPDGCNLGHYSQAPDRRRRYELAVSVLGLLLTYWRGYMYTLDYYWVIGGVLCGLLLRFEFLGGAIEKIIRALELLVFGYVVWSCVKLLLQW
jgi:hypothetical protein